jgi:hypothetical protein
LRNEVHFPYLAISSCIFELSEIYG